MSELEEKLSALLSNPQLMQQISAMAQAMGQTPMSQPVPKPQAQSPVPAMDPRMLQAISGALQGSSVDQEQQELLHALSPFLSPVRISKLERAMRASKMAGFASVFLKSGGLNLFGGR